MQDAVSVVETDCEVDFAPPLDYVEPQREERPPAAAAPAPADAAGGQYPILVFHFPAMPGTAPGCAVRTRSGAMLHRYAVHKAPDTTGTPHVMAALLAALLAFTVLAKFQRMGAAKTRRRCMSLRPQRETGKHTSAQIFVYGSTSDILMRRSLVLSTARGATRGSKNS